MRNEGGNHLEGGDSCDCSAKDQAMDIVGSLVGDDSFKVDCVANNVIFIDDAVSAKHVACDTCHIERLPSAVALQHGDGRMRQFALILETAGTQASVETESDFGAHIGKFRLNELVGGKRFVELLSVHGVLAGDVEATFSSSQRTPCDAVPGTGKAPKWTLQSLGIRQHILLWDEAVRQLDSSGDAGTQGHFTFDLRCGESLERALNNEAANRVTVVFSPDDCEICDGRRGDPHLGTVQHVTTINFLGTRGHGSWVRPGIGLCKTEASDELSSGKLGKELLLLCLRSVFVDGIHDKGALHGPRAAVGTVDSLDLAGYQARSDIGSTGAAIATQAAT